MDSKIFDAYSAYYDLLYRNKAYGQEVVFLREIIEEFCPNAKNIVDLGCGTGVHDWLLSEAGFNVLGIDQSDAMLEVARERSQQYPGVANVPEFRTGTLESFNVDARADVIVSLFDVVSYLRDYDAFRAFAGNVSKTLKSGGLLIFDCWYGPAVYTQRPGIRVRKLENEQIALTRLVESDFMPRHNHIDVHYDMFVRRKSDGVVSQIGEMHKLRCYFDDELDLLLGESGLLREFSFQWFTRAPATMDTWSVLFGYRLP